MAKTLCKSKKLRKIAKQAVSQNPCGMSVVCRKCGRQADSKKQVCKPEKVG